MMDYSHHIDEKTSNWFWSYPKLPVIILVKQRLCGFGMRWKEKGAYDYIIIESCKCSLKIVGNNFGIRFNNMVLRVLFNTSYLINILSEELPPHEYGDHISNSDPVTGQAAWFDVAVQVYKASDDEPKQTSPQFEPVKPYPAW